MELKYSLELSESEPEVSVINVFTLVGHEVELDSGPSRAREQARHHGDEAKKKKN